MGADRARVSVRPETVLQEFLRFEPDFDVVAIGGALLEPQAMGFQPNFGLRDLDRSVMDAKCVHVASIVGDSAISCSARLAGHCAFFVLNDSAPHQSRRMRPADGKSGQDDRFFANHAQRVSDEIRYARTMPSSAALARSSSKRILIIQGHPDAQRIHFCHALAEAYTNGAKAAGHSVSTINIAEIEFPLLRNRENWESGPVPASLQAAQLSIGTAEHIVLIFPLWLGSMPAVVKGFLEQVLRPGFALDNSGARFPKKRLVGRSARVIVTMGMPALWYKWFFRAHGVRSLERSILKFCGIHPVRESLIGLVEAGVRVRQRWLKKCRAYGERAT